MSLSSYIFLWINLAYRIINQNKKKNKFRNKKNIQNKKKKYYLNMSE